MNILDIKEKGLLLFECIGGSKAYGLDTPQSDTDLRGVYYLPKEQFYGLNYIRQVAANVEEIFDIIHRRIKIYRIVS